MRSAEEANRRHFFEAYRTGEHGWAVEEPNSQVVEFLERVREAAPGGRLLDLGCGEGRHCIAAARMGFRVTGVDYEPLALERAREFARQAGTQGIGFVVADALALPFKAGSFDVFLDYGCLHHLRKADWPAYLSGLLRVLAPQGHYLLSVFSPGFPFFRGRKRKWLFAEGAYHRCFTREDVEELCGEHFAILEMQEDGGEDKGLWHVLMRRRPVAQGSCGR